jgi:hypothetical protein
MAAASNRYRQSVQRRNPGHRPHCQSHAEKNASVSRRHSRRSSKSLAKTCKSGSHKPVAPRSRIHAPYPIIPANELFGTLLMELKRPTDAKEGFLQALKRTPGRPKAIYGIARAAEASGDRATAQQRYQEFLALCKNADADRPEVAIAKEFLAKVPTLPR